MPPQGQTQGLSYKDQDQDQDLNFVLKDSLRTRTRTRPTTLSLGPTSESSSSGSLSGSGKVTLEQWSHLHSLSADWLHLNTFPHAEDALSMTRRFPNTWKTGFAVKASQCSSHLYRSKPWTNFLIQLKQYTVLTDYIWNPFHMRKMLYQGPEGSSTLEKPVSPWRQINALAIYSYTESNHE